MLALMLLYMAQAGECHNTPPKTDANSPPATVVYPIPGVTGGQVCIVRDRAAMKAGPGTKRVVIPPEPPAPKPADRK